jgi:hypothetical protein
MASSHLKWRGSWSRAVCFARIVRPQLMCQICASRVFPRRHIRSRDNWRGPLLPADGDHCPRRPGIRRWSSRTGWRGLIALAPERRRHRDSVRGEEAHERSLWRETQGWPQRRRRAGGDAACCSRSPRSGTPVELSWILSYFKAKPNSPVTCRQALVTHVRALWINPRLSPRCCHHDGVRPRPSGPTGTAPAAAGRGRPRPDENRAPAIWLVVSSGRAPWPPAGGPFRQIFI